MIVKQDSSVTEFIHSRMGTQYVLTIVALIAPIALAYYVSPERQRNCWNHQRVRQAARSHQECQRNSWRDGQVARVHGWINYKEKLHKSDMQPYAGFVT
jgi:hypothetical protein